jgi:putative addiction module killer protein
VATIQALEHLDSRGNSPYAAWFASLDALPAAKVAAAVYRLSEGNSSEVKGVGGGVLERRIDSGPGYRIYFGRDGDTIVILLGGGTKRRQQADIRAAQARWSDYKQRKAKQENR